MSDSSRYKQISRLNYLLGRLEGIASMAGDEKIQAALLDTVEWLDELLSKGEGE